MADSYTVPDAVAKTLAYNNLLHVFSNRDASSRATVIKETYHPDAIMYEQSEVLTGHEAINAKAQSLLDEREGWAFEPLGNVIKNHGMVYLAWGFGPRGGDGVVDVKVTGADVIIVEEGKIRKFWVVLEGVSDVKG